MNRITKVARALAQHEQRCAAEAAAASTAQDFIAWGQRSMAWGLARRLGLSYHEAVDLVDTEIEEEGLLPS